MKSPYNLCRCFQEESLTFQSQLDGLEAEILRQRQELRGLQVTHADARLSRDAARVRSGKLAGAGHRCASAPVGSSHLSREVTSTSTALVLAQILVSHISC